MRLKINSNCLGYGVCMTHSDELFELGDDDVAHIRIDPVPEALEAIAEEAVMDCPARAIELAENG